MHSPLWATVLRSRHNMLSAELAEECELFARTQQESRYKASLEENDLAAPLTGSGCWDGDPHAVSQAEALSYYAGLPSEPTLVYRTGKPWSPPRGLEAQRRKKELRPVFEHPIVDLWRESMGMEVVEIMDAHKVYFTTIDVVRFRMLDVDDATSDEEQHNQPTVPADGPVTIWIGVFPESTSPSTAHAAAQDVLTLLAQHHITDIDVDFRESLYTRTAGPPLLRPASDLDPLADVASPLTPALGLPISSRAAPALQGTMALYLDAGDERRTLLGLTCRHVLFSSGEGNLDYAARPGAPPRDVVLLGTRAYTDLVDAVRLRIGRHVIAATRWRKQIAALLEKEKAGDAAAAARAAKDRAKTQALVADAEEAMDALAALLRELTTRWKRPADRVLGAVVRAPPVALGVGEERFVEDWAVFRVDRAKLGEGFQGNVLDLGPKLIDDLTTLHLSDPTVDPADHPDLPTTRLLPLTGILTLTQLQHPDTRDASGAPSLRVVQHGAASGPALGCASGALSLVREYFACDAGVHRTAFAWAVLPRGSGDGAGGQVGKGFSKPGDSGAVVADLRGRVGGVLVGGAGNGREADVAYATPFWWLLERVREGGFPGAGIEAC